MKKFGSDLGSGIKKTGTAVGSVWEDFIKFINRGSVVDLAVGVVMGAAFTAIVNSFVSDLITPVIGLASQKNLVNNFLVIRCSSNSTICRTGSEHPYSTLTAAQTDGAVTWNWGSFINTVINFILISIFVFILVKLYAAAFLRFKKKDPPKTKACAVCCEDVLAKAKICKYCHSVFPEEDAPSTSGTPQPESGFRIPSPFKKKSN
ncbi:hypothetical protein HK405_012586 [Cladochytrium tenue]|nr:hypothetical protein HK405_012586 [Cladochytrium tenue]